MAVNDHNARPASRRVLYCAAGETQNCSARSGKSCLTPPRIQSTSSAGSTARLKIATSATGSTMTALLTSGDRVLCKSERGNGSACKCSGTRLLGADSVRCLSCSHLQKPNMNPGGLSRKNLIWAAIRMMSGGR